MNQDKLTIRDFPVSLWLTGIALLAAAIFFLTKSVFLMAGIMGTLGLLALFGPAALTVTADKSSQILTLRYGLILPRSVKQIPFSEIQTIRVDSHTTRDHSSPTHRHNNYRLELVKQVGSVIPFRSYYSSDFLLKQRRAENFVDLSAWQKPSMKLRLASCAPPRKSLNRPSKDNKKR